VFVLGYQDHPIQRRWLKLYKLGDGPLYTFYTPYHLCHLEAPLTIGRAVLFGDCAAAPIGKPLVEVVAAAKRDLHAGEMLDGIGGFMTYGLCENVEVARPERLLPMGIAEGCRMTRDVGKDSVLSYHDVQIPEGRLSDKLREEQESWFAPHAAASQSVAARWSAPSALRAQSPA
jgi:predicted homoserine dehydrogenase-like protein